MKKNSFQSELAKSFKKHASHIAIEYGNKQITFEELDTRSACISNWIHHHRIPQGSFIGIYTEDKIDFITVMIGILKARCVFVPLDTSLPYDRIKAMIGSVRTEFLFSDPVHKDVLKDECRIPETISVFAVSDSLCHADDPGNNPGHSPEDAIYIYFTSGTTGTPKAIVGKNKSLLHFIKWEIDRFSIDASFRVSQFIAPGFDAFLRDVFVPLLSGGTLCIPEQKDIVMSDEISSWTDANQIDLIHCVPSIFRLISRHDLSSDNFKRLKYVLLSGEKIIPRELKHWYDIFDERIQLVNLYGPSETTMVKSCYFIRKSDAETEKISIGKPIPGSQIIILDKNMAACDYGIVGEIYIRTPFRTLGYCNNAELNRELFIQNPFSDDPNDLLYKTGDLGREKPDGNFELLGRTDRQVKIRGVRIELEEVENTILQCPQVKNAVVMAREDKSGEKQLCAYIVFSENATTSLKVSDLTDLTKEEAQRKKINDDDSLWLNKNEKIRYDRQMLLDGWGVASQEKLKRTTVFAAGAGGSGSALVMQLALIGFGTIMVCDFDHVELSNLNRQCLHDESRVGMNKAASAKMTVQRINPDVNVTEITQKITKDNIFELIGNAEIIFDNVDDIEAKFIISECAVKKKIPHIISSMMDMNSYAAVFHTPITPCFHCLYDISVVQEIRELKMADSHYEKKPLPVAAPSLFLSTGFAVNEALKILLGVGRPAYNKYFLFNQRGSGEIAETDGYQQIVFPFSPHFKKISREQGFDWDQGWRGCFLEELTTEKDKNCLFCGEVGKDQTLQAGSENIRGDITLISHLPRREPKADIHSLPDWERGAGKDDISSDVANLRKFLSGKVPDYMIPTCFLQIDKIPLKPNGKVEWESLPEPGITADENYIAPAEGLEQKIAEIWSRVLGVEESIVGRDTNFFDLGGHSLKATKIISLVNKQLRVRIPLVEVFRSPTVRQLAGYIRGPAGESLSVKDENLVLLKQGTDKNNHLFMVHAGNGQVEAYIEFCNNLNDKFNCWAFSIGKLKNYSPEKLTNESIAKKYVAQIKHVCKEGPYYIAGWCLGGPLALEIVRQLEDMSEAVAFLGLIDSNVPQSEWMVFDKCEFTRDVELQYIRSLINDDRLMKMLNSIPDMQQMWQTVADYLETNNFDTEILKKSVTRNVPGIRRGIDLPVIPNYEHVSTKEMIYSINVIRTLRNARAAYIPSGKIRVPVSYFEATRTFIENEKDRWNLFFQTPLKTLTVEGDHYSIFQIPEVLDFAKIFEKEMANA